MRLKRKHSEGESVESKRSLIKEEKAESVVAEVGVGEEAEADSTTNINMDKTTANREMLKIIKETPSNSSETSTLAMLGVSVYNEATFKRHIQLALTRGGDINIALIDASKHCRFDLIQPLVDLGANVNFGDEIGMTPLHIAAANLNIQGVGILLNLGANKRAKANTGSSSKPKMQTPVQIARDWKKLIAKNIGICNPEVELVIELLK